MHGFYMLVNSCTPCVPQAFCWGRHPAGGVACPKVLNTNELLFLWIFE